MHRCAHCHGRFGLVSHRRFFKRFCSRRCRNTYQCELIAAIEVRLRSWQGALVGMDRLAGAALRVTHPTR